MSNLGVTIVSLGGSIGFMLKGAGKSPLRGLQIVCTYTIGVLLHIVYGTVHMSNTDDSDETEHTSMLE